MSDPQPSNQLQELQEQVRLLTEKLRDEADARKFLQTRLSQHEGRIREVEQRTLSILRSRTWRALVAGGGRILWLRQRAWFWKERFRLACLTMVHLVRFSRETALIHIDFPSAKTARLSGKVKIRGWAIAQSGIEKIEIRIGNRLLVEASTGLRRVDVAREFPEFPGVDKSGFSVIVDLSSLPEGDYPVLIYARSRKGALAGHRIRIHVQNGPERRPWSVAAVREALESMQRKPVISILMPVFETPERWLRRAIESVQGQIYPHWELCVADDCSRTPRVRQILEEYRGRDQRIKVAYRSSNGHIAAASNSALEMATGEFVALLDHDDEITADALMEMALAYNANPSADMLYSDEDKIDEDDFCSDPFYKPDWSPEYFLTCMYTCHLGVYRTALVRELGGFRPNSSGAQDYDLALRLVSRTARVVHVPKVLYHWRTHQDSTALSGENKDYAYPAAQRALQDYLDRSPLGGEVLPGPRYGFHRIRFNIRGEPKVSVVIPSAGRMVDYEGKTLDLLRECVDSILEKSAWQNREIIVVDNGDLREELKSWLEPRVRLITYQDKHFNLARKINLGARHATGEHLLLLNDDVKVIAPDWIENMLQYSQQTEIGAVGAKLLFPNGRIQHAGVVLLNARPGHAYYDHPSEEIGYFLSAVLTRNCLAVTGACLMTKRALFEQMGGFSEEFPLNFNDVDFCLRLHQQGYRIVYVPEATLYHYESLSKEGAGKLQPGELERFLGKWDKFYSVDPYYNPNLPMDYLYYEVE